MEEIMATVTIRDLDEKVVAKLKARAKSNHRSLEAELRELLSVVVKEQERRQRFLAKADRIATMTPKIVQSDSAQLLREDRRRWVWSLTPAW
jgi:plasmid stability protein